jgi:hypothetical protein
MTDEPHPTIAPLLDFSNAMLAGTGLTRSHDTPDIRGQKFDENLKSGEFSQSGVEGVATTLMENIRRLHSHASMPYQIFNYGRRFQEVYAKFYAEPARSQMENISDDQMRDFQAREKAWLWILGREPHYSDIGWSTSGQDVAGFAIAPEVSPYAHDNKRTQINAFCASLVIEAWALFESLSEDLWEAALNFHPTVLGALDGIPRSKYRAPRNEAARQNTTQSTLRMSFDDLQRKKFDVSSCIGTILKRNDNIGFRSIYDIRASYHRAFSAQSNSIDEILDDSGLQYAAAVRNLLIHKRGIVDDEFEKQVSGINGVPAVVPDDKFPLSGAICSELADTCRVCAVWLVMAVHGWIVGHPERERD